MQKFLFLAFICACAIAGLMEPYSETEKSQTVQLSPKEIDKKIDETIKNMSLEEKVGQMIMMGIEGENLTDDAKVLLKEYHIGGVILFDKNIKDPEQVKNLITNLKENSDDKSPLLIATDEEGGVSARLKDYITPPTAAKFLGDAGDADKAREEMKIASEKLKELGFNVNFAPVADLNLPNDRFYSDDPNVTADFVKAAATGVYEGGLIPCVKHFPGFASVDYVNGILSSNKSKTEISANDLQPYKNLKNAEFPYFIMINNAVYKNIDKNPASVSKTVINKLLREELNFQGVVITDDLSGGVLPQFTPAERAVKAINAGADIALSCKSYKDTKEMYLGIIDACKKEKIPTSKINAAVKKILKAKMTIN